MLSTAPVCGTTKPVRTALALVCALAAWVSVYVLLPVIADFLTHGILRIAPKSRLGSSVGLFFYQAPKMMMVLILVIFVAGVIRSFFRPERIRAILAGRSELIGGILASALGVVTPFCNCSAIPLFIGFLEAGVPLGVTFSFLIAAPMVNEVAVAMLLSIFGWRVAGIYAVAGILIAISAGWAISKLKMERFVEEWVLQMRIDRAATPESVMTMEDRVHLALNAVRENVRRVWPYALAGIAVGAVIHGYVPERVLVTLCGKHAWWSVPAAVLVGIPMYSNAAGIIPLMQALMEKGAALGTALAFMMSVIGLSLPEVVILRRVLKPRLLAVFVGVQAIGILLVGLLFNAIL